MKKPRDISNPAYTQISVYVVLTFVALLVTYAVFGNLPALGAGIARVLSPFGIIITPLVGGLVIAYLLLPPVERLQRRLQAVPALRERAVLARTLAIVITAILLVAVILVALGAILATVVGEVQQLSLTHLDTTLGTIGAAIQSNYHEFESWLAAIDVSSDQLGEAVQYLSDSLATMLDGFGDSVLTGVSELPKFVSNLLFSLIFAIYLMLDTEHIATYWDGVLLRLFGARVHQAVHSFLADADHAFSGYIRGQLLDAIFMGFAASIVLSLVGVKFSFLIGILSGIGNLIPYVGPIVAFASTALVCLLEGDLATLVSGIVALAVVQFIDANVVNPKLLSDNVEVHPLLVIAALLLGGEVGGFVGMLVAVPLAALAKTLFQRLVDYLGARKGLPPLEETDSNAGTDISSDS